MMLCLSSSSESLSLSQGNDPNNNLSQNNGNNLTQYSNSLSQGNATNLTQYSSSLSQGNDNNFTPYNSQIDNTPYNSLSQSRSLSQSDDERKYTLSSSQNLSRSAEIKIKQALLRKKIDGEKPTIFEPQKKSKRAMLRRDDTGATNFDPRFRVEVPDLRTIPIEKEKPNYSIAKLKQNEDFNRYPNILVEDDKIYAPNIYEFQGKKVELSEYYLNAVLIPLMLEEKQITYVATQAPKENCFNEFWLAAIVNDTDTIVNLAMPLEENKLKCDDYWSHQYWKEIGHFTIKDGNRVIGTLTKHLDIADEIIACSGNERLVKRNFVFTSNIDENDTRIITQFHYENWPDGDVPKDLLLFEKLIEEVDKSGSKKGPPIIHCSAGIGRTGTFIVTDFSLKQIKEQIKKQVALNVDPMQVIKYCREFRKGIVQTQEQLDMVYKIILRFGETLFKETYNSQSLITNLNKV